jgi:hypothetical protein
MLGSASLISKVLLFGKYKPRGSKGAPTVPWLRTSVEIAGGIQGTDAPECAAADTASRYRDKKVAAPGSKSRWREGHLAKSSLAATKRRFLKSRLQRFGPN